jgi:hypothetical protein
MKKPIWTIPVILIIAYSLTGTGCYYDKEEILYPGTTCDTTTVSYGTFIQPLISSKCNSCHNSSAASGSGGGIVLDSYTAVKYYVDNARFTGAVNHEAGYSPMPENGPKLPACELSKINAWVNAGAPQN